MKFFTLALLIAVASGADCVDDNVKAKKQLVVDAKAAVTKNTEESTAEKDADKKKLIDAKAPGLKKAVETAEGDLIVAQNTCTPGDAAPEPVDAKSQLAKANNAKAVTDLKEWKELTDAEAKQKAKYDAMDATAKKAWDDKRAAGHKAKEERDAKEKTAADFAKLTVEQQTVYMGGLLAWKKDKYKKCNEAPEGNDCKFADALRDKQEKKRNTDKYYTKTKDERSKDDAGQAAAQKADLAGLVAAAVKPVEVKKPVVAVGTSCVKNGAGVRPACGEGHCCGIAKKGFFGGSKEVCDVKTNTQHKFKNGDVQESWSFSCINGAKQFAAGIATAMVASYMMA